MDRPLILLVDDEPGIRLTLSMLLEEEGYRLVTAEHGREALDRLGEMRPDLIITDHMMPHLTGLELIAAIRAQPDLADIPILLMSGALPMSMDLAAMAADFLQKPTDFKRLFRLVERRVGGASRG